METTLEKVNGAKELIKPDPQQSALVRLHHNQDLAKKIDLLNEYLNNPPDKSWLKDHPLAKKKVNGKWVPCQYIPIERIEMLLRQIFGIAKLHVIDYKQIANSVTVHVRLFIPSILKEGDWLESDGLGASPLQTDEGAGAIEWDKIKSSAVQIALPAAKSYAAKDAAEWFGKIFGSDINRAEQIEFEGLFNPRAEVSHDDLVVLFELKKEALNATQRASAQKIIDEKQTNSYSKLHQFLNKL